MSKIFNCPACGKPMEYDGKTTLFQTCGSCHAPIVVPTEVVEENRIANVDISSTKPETASAPDYEPGSIHDPKIVANARIFEAVNSGNKLEAIKLHREAFSTDLAASKEAVETLERQIARSKDIEKPTPQISSAHFDDFARLLSKGQKIEAIKLFRERFNTSLSDAKDAVEAIERGETP